LQPIGGIGCRTGTSPWASPPVAAVCRARAPASPRARPAGVTVPPPPEPTTLPGGHHAHLTPLHLQHLLRAARCLVQHPDQHVQTRRRIPLSWHASTTTPPRSSATPRWCASTPSA